MQSYLVRSGEGQLPLAPPIGTAKQKVLPCPPLLANHIAGSFSCQFGGVGYRHVERRGTWTKSNGGLREGARPARGERKASSPACDAGAVDGGDALRSKELVRHRPVGAIAAA